MTQAGFAAPLGVQAAVTNNVITRSFNIVFLPFLAPDAERSGPSCFLNVFGNTCSGPASASHTALLLTGFTRFFGVRSLHAIQP